MKWTAWLTSIMLLISWSLYSPERSDHQNKLAEIRRWALSNSLWPNLTRSDPPPLIGVREVYQVEQAQLRLNAYLLIPCEEVCGATANCLRHCQTLMVDWEGQSSKARLMIEGYDLKQERPLGRLILDHVSPVELRYWSRRHGLISLIQTRSAREKSLILLKLRSDEQARRDQMDSKGHKGGHPTEQPTTEPALWLTKYDELSLGPYHGQESPLEGSVSFRDLDGDDQVDLIAPLERLVHLKPLQIFVPTPYRLTERGLRRAPDLINVISPRSDEIREWLIALRGENEVKPSIERIKRLFSFCLLLRLKGEGERADQLVNLAYPQYPPVLHLWSQLGEHLRLETDQDNAAKREPPPLKIDPFSALDK